MKALEAEGCSGKITEGMVRRAIDPARAVEAKRSLGGPSPRAVRATLKRQQAAVRALRLWNRSRFSAVERARRMLREQIRKSC